MAKNLFFINNNSLWNQFCEFIPIAGFRFMTTKTSLTIRLLKLFFILFYVINRWFAFTIFILSVSGLISQLIYLLQQYLKDSVLISSRQYRVNRVTLPLIYFCNVLSE